MEIPLMEVAAVAEVTWLCKILRIYPLNPISLPLVREETIKAMVALHHLIHYCRQTEAARGTLIIRTVALAAAAEIPVQAHAGVETVNTEVAVVAIADTEALVVMGATAVYTAVAVVAVLVS